MRKSTSLSLPLSSTLLLVLFCRSTTADQALSVPEIYQQTRRSTAWVVAKNDNKSIKIGTGFLVDRSRKLLVTNHHVVDKSDKVEVTFPLYQGHEAVAERKSYIRYDRPVRGWVVATDPTRDLAVIELEVVPHATSAMKLAADSTCPGERVHLVGNPGTSELLWVYNSGTVHQVSSRQLKDDRTGKMIRAIAAEILTQSPVLPGNSGGPVVNDRAELVGVATMSNQAVHLAWCIDVSEVKDVVRIVREYPKSAQRLLNPRSPADFTEREQFYREYGPADNAVARLTDLLRLDPKNALAFHSRGAAHARQGDYDHAIADFSEAIRFDSKNPLTYYNRALAYVQQNNHDRAIADFTKAIDLEPKNTPSYLDRGGAHQRKGEYGQAVADFSRVLELDPQNIVAYNTLAWIWATCPDDKLRDGKKAKEYATKICESTGWMNASFLDTLAAACAECGQFSEAVEWQRKAARIARPEDRARLLARMKIYQTGHAYHGLEK
jgi:Flp pilus assembly protein TadD